VKQRRCFMQINSWYLTRSLLASPPLVVILVVICQGHPCAHFRGDGLGGQDSHYYILHLTQRFACPRSAPGGSSLVDLEKFQADGNAAASGLPQHGSHT
jgi:hypothetical protein